MIYDNSATCFTEFNTKNTDFSKKKSRFYTVQKCPGLTFSLCRFSADIHGEDVLVPVCVAIS